MYLKFSYNSILGSTTKGFLVVFCCLTRVGTWYWFFHVLTQSREACYQTLSCKRILYGIVRQKCHHAMQAGTPDHGQPDWAVDRTKVTARKILTIAFALARLDCGQWWRRTNKLCPRSTPQKRCKNCMDSAHLLKTRQPCHKSMAKAPIRMSSDTHISSIALSVKPGWAQPCFCVETH